MRTDLTFRFMDGPLAGLYLHVLAKDDPGSLSPPGYSVYVAGPVDDEAANNDEDDTEWFARYRFREWSHDCANLTQSRHPQDLGHPAELMLRRPGVDWFNGLADSQSPGDGGS